MSVQMTRAQLEAKGCSLWADCDWALPEGVEAWRSAPAHLRGSVVTLLNTANGFTVSVVEECFSPRALPEVIQRLNPEFRGKGASHRAARQ